MFTGILSNLYQTLTIQTKWMIWLFPEIFVRFLQMLICLFHLYPMDIFSNNLRPLTISSPISPQSNSGLTFLLAGLDFLLPAPFCNQNLILCNQFPAKVPSASSVHTFSLDSANKWTPARYKSSRTEFSFQDDITWKKVVFCKALVAHNLADRQNTAFKCQCMIHSDSSEEDNM